RPARREFGPGRARSIVPTKRSFEGPRPGRALTGVATGKSSRIVKVLIFIMPQRHDPGRKSSEKWARNDRRDRSGRPDDAGPRGPTGRSDGLTTEGHARPCGRVAQVPGHRDL